MALALAPVITGGDPPPAELIAEADTLCHRAGDMLMRASVLAGQMRRAEPADALARATTILADEARATAEATVRLGERLAALAARAAR